MGSRTKKNKNILPVAMGVGASVSASVAKHPRGAKGRRGLVCLEAMTGTARGIWHEKQRVEWMVILHSQQLSGKSAEEA